MGRSRTAGLFLRGGVWHVDKRVRGFGRLCESTGASDPGEAERYLARRLEEIRQATVYGVRPTRLFRQAATKYLEDELLAGTKRSLSRDAQALKAVDPYIGDLALRQVHMGTLQSFIQARRKAGRQPATIRRDLATVRRILNLAARLWRDENGMTWLETPPLIQMPKGPARQPYPLSWEEQRHLFDQLPAHLQAMALFKVNTGCREQEICRLRWDWEVQVPELATSVFIIPGHQVKNGEERLVVLNRIAASVIEAQRGKHPEVVFTYRGQPVTKMYNSAWKRARREAAKAYAKESGRPAPAGFAAIRVHDLKHTFGRRLRAAGVSFEDRQDLLGHRSGRITTHYSAAELGNLIAAATTVCGDNSRKTPALVVLRGGAAVGRAA